MKTHDLHSLEDQRTAAGKPPPRTPGVRQESIEGSLRDLQSAAGNRAVSDLVSGAHPTVQGSFFGGFGGVEDWIAKETSGAASGFDGSVKQDAGDTSLKQEPADQSVKVGDASDKWDPSQKVDASDKWEPSQKLDASDKWDGSEKSEAEPAAKDDAMDAATSEFEEF